MSEGWPARSGPPVEPLHRVLGDLLQERRRVLVDLAEVVVAVAHGRLAVDAGEHHAGGEVGAVQAGVGAVVALVQLEVRAPFVGFLERQADGDDQRADRVARLHIQLFDRPDHRGVVFLVRLGIGMGHVERRLAAGGRDLLGEVGDGGGELGRMVLFRRGGAEALQDDELERVLHPQLARLQIAVDVVVEQHGAADGGGFVLQRLQVRQARGRDHAPHVVVQAVVVIEIAVADEQHPFGLRGLQRLDGGGRGVRAGGGAQGGEGESQDGGGEQGDAQGAGAGKHRCLLSLGLCPWDVCSRGPWALMAPL